MSPLGRIARVKWGLESPLRLGISVIFGLLRAKRPLWRRWTRPILSLVFPVSAPLRAQAVFYGVFPARWLQRSYYRSTYVCPMNTVKSSSRRRTTVVRRAPIKRRSSTDRGRVLRGLQALIYRALPTGRYAARRVVAKVQPFILFHALPSSSPTGPWAPIPKSLP